MIKECSYSIQILTVILFVAWFVFRVTPDLVSHDIVTDVGGDLTDIALPAEPTSWRTNPPITMVAWTHTEPAYLLAVAIGQFWLWQVGWTEFKRVGGTNEPRVDLVASIAEEPKFIMLSSVGSNVATILNAEDGTYSTVS